VDAGRSEEHDRILDVLLPEAAERLEVLGQDPDRTCVRALEEFVIVIRERLLMG
jgi:hypothetical protein